MKILKNLNSKKNIEAKKNGENSNNFNKNKSQVKIIKNNKKVWLKMKRKNYKKLKNLQNGNF